MKLILAVAAASALLLSSCLETDEVTSTDYQLDELEFTATIDGPSTKTTVNTDGSDEANRGKIEWVKGDTITITDVTGNVSVLYVAVGNGATSTFRKAANQDGKKLGSGPYSATYGTAPLTTQNYADHHSEVANQAKNVYMEAPESATRSLTFKAACGLLKLTLTAADGESDETISKIEVSGKINDRDTTYTLKCVGEEGTAVPISTATDFYLTLPAGSYNDMCFYNNAGVVCQKSPIAAMTITDNKIQPVTINNVSFSLFPGKFTINAEGKQIRFTKGNLWWDGSNWHFESSQTAYPTTWSTEHVSHFYWTKTAESSYAESYSDGTCSVEDRLFCDGSDAEHTLTVDGQSGLRALSIEEWSYLLKWGEREKKWSWVTINVNGSTNKYLVIPPDGFEGEIQKSYDADAWSDAESSGFICLPFAGYRDGSNFKYVNDYGFYLSSSLKTSSETYQMRVADGDLHNDFAFSRSQGALIRLVKTVSE